MDLMDLVDKLPTLFSSHSRKIELFIPNVVISEHHIDTLEITSHPVENGASISDHAYLKAAELTMDVGFSAGGSLLDFTDTRNLPMGLGVELGLSPGDTYKALLDLQASRVPFDVVTGKRIYKNMLIRVLDVTTDRNSENVLLAKLTLSEVIITSTQRIAVADQRNMALGASTSAVQNTGTKSVKTVRG